MQEYKDQYLFGLIDGLNGAVGLVIGLLSSSVAAPIIAVALLSRAGSSSVSMAGAELESDECDKGLLYKRTAAMGLGYLTSALLPGLGFLIDLHFGIPFFTLTTILLLVIIANFRAKQVGWFRSIRTTLVIFVLAVGAGLLATFIVH